MAAPNAQPAGSRPGPAAVHEHAPNQAGKPSSGFAPGSGGKGQGVAGHSTPAPVGKGKSNPLK